MTLGRVAVQVWPYPMRSPVGTLRSATTSLRTRITGRRSGQRLSSDPATGGATRRHARVHLQVEGERRRAGVADQRGEALDVAGVIDDGRELVLEDLLEALASGPVVAAHHQDGDADAGGAQLDRLLEQRHAQ